MSLKSKNLSSSHLGKVGKLGITTQEHSTLMPFVLVIPHNFPTASSILHEEVRVSPPIQLKEAYTLHTPSHTTHASKLGHTHLPYTAALEDVSTTRLTVTDLFTEADR